jgi:hypothetical protein
MLEDTEIDGIKSFQICGDQTGLIASSACSGRKRS